MATIDRKTASSKFVLRAGCALAVTVMTALSGCGSPSSTGSPATAVAPASSSAPDPAAMSVTPTPTETPAPPVLGPAKKYIVTVKSSQGYAQEATLTLYPGYKGSDRAALSQGWAAVGGTGENPCNDVNPANDMITNYTLKTDTSYFVFGTLTIQNKSNGFRPEPTTWQWVGNTGGRSGVWSDPDPSIDTDFAVMGVGYSSGGDCDGLMSGGFMINPKWSDAGDQWGPVPVAVAISGVYTPNHPAGNMKNITAFRLNQGPFGGSVTDASGKKIQGIPLPMPANP
ncbi:MULTISPECIES: hypothetical protein [Terrabacteria group]|uniref:hypothetical protein n=1 Tax=Bacillati TaxID=1783272 RepID=UPI00362EF47C